MMNLTDNAQFCLYFRKKNKNKKVVIITVNEYEYVYAYFLFLQSHNIVIIYDYGVIKFFFCLVLLYFDQGLT